MKGVISDLKMKQNTNSQESILEQITALGAKIEEKQKEYTTLNQIYKQEKAENAKARKE